MAEQHTHGGKRPHAGRKPLEPDGRDVAYRLYPRHLAAIARWQQEHGCTSASEAVRQIIETVS